MTTSSKTPEKPRTVALVPGRDTIRLPFSRIRLSAFSASATTGRPMPRYALKHVRNSSDDCRIDGDRIKRKRGEGPLTMCIVWKAWRRLAIRAGVRLVRFHDLRDTTATVMLSQGIDVPTVADVLGHSDVSTTLRTYVQSTEGATRRGALVMGEALA